MMLQVLAGFDPQDPASQDVLEEDYLAHIGNGVKGWRVALAVGEYIDASDPDVLAGVQAAAQVFKSLGAQLENVDLSWIADLSRANNRMTQADAAAYHRERLAAHPDWFGSDVLQRLQAGAALPSSEYVLARRMQAEGRRRFEMFFTKYDLLLLPTIPIPAPPIEGIGTLEAVRQFNRFTAPFNLTGHPSLSIPCGFTGIGLPVGLQIVAKHWGEAIVLQAGYSFQHATDWHLRQPDLVKTHGG